MPSKSRREDAIIELFVSAYEDSAWKGSCICWLDRVLDGAVDALVMRSDGKTLAIEHTLIQPFEDDRFELEGFKATFLPIEGDPALRQVDRIVYVNVPRGALPKGIPWVTIGKCVQRWLQTNLAQLGEGDGYHDCPVKGHGIAKPFTMRLHIKVVSSKGSDCGPLIRRYGSTGIDATVEKALVAKLPKLADTSADKRILLLERNQWTLGTGQIWREIQRQASNFPQLSKIDEIWFAETVFYDTSTDPHWRDYLRFEKHSGDEARLVSMAFRYGNLIEGS